MEIDKRIERQLLCNNASTKFEGGSRSIINMTKRLWCDFKTVVLIQF